MKKQLSKKLVFTKETISNLNSGELKAVKGGYVTASCPDDGCETTANPYCTAGCPSVKIVYCE